MPTYTVDTTSFINNPERGFMGQITGGQSTAYYTAEKAAGRMVQNVLIYLDAYRTIPLDSTILTSVTNRLTELRNNGCKCVLRFSYNHDGSTVDATPARVLGHIDQLATIIQNNSDVIAIWEAGFVGAWGEFQGSDNFGLDTGGSPPNLNLSTQNWTDRKSVIDRMLSVLPTSRCVMVRQPVIKQHMYGTTALADASAFNLSANARVGHFNDCFLDGSSDGGTYFNTSTEYPYLIQETKWLPMGGETCAVAAPRTDCPTAQSELGQFHWSVLNETWNPSVYSAWTSQGCFDTVKRSLGYRLSLTSATLPTAIVLGQGLAITLNIVNNGYAAPFNPRPAKLIFRNTVGGAVFTSTLAADPRRWTPGTTVVQETVSLPAGIPAGTYNLLLHLPDADAGLAANPLYAIQLANTGLWESTTGYNSLQSTLAVSASANTPPPTPPIPFARNASYVVGETSHPDTSVFVLGENVWLYFWGAGLPANGTDSLTVTTLNDAGISQGNSVIQVTADASGNWQAVVQAPAPKYGYYKVTALTGGGKSLPAFGTRFSGYLTYAVVFDPTQRQDFGELATRFGMQGSLQPNAQDAFAYIGVRWQLDSDYRWGDQESGGANTYNTANSNPLPAMLYRGASWKTYGMVSILANMPAWAVVSGPLGDLNASGQSNLAGYCTKVANRYIANNPNRTDSLIEIMWEPYPGRWTGTNAGFVQIHQIAYNAIKSAYSAAGKTCHVMSPTLFPAYTEMTPWVQAGLTNYIDAYSVHAYVPDATATMGGLAAQLQGDATLFNNAKGSVLQRFNNESAWPTNRAGDAIYDESGLTAARGDIQNALVCLGEGFRYTMLFYIADFTDENIGWGHFFNLNPAFGGGYGSPKVSPKIHVPAVSCMTKLLDGSTSQGSISLGGTAFGYQFLRQDGKTVRAVGDFSTASTKSVPVPNGQVDVYDWMGNFTTSTVSTGSLILSVSPSPTYLVTPGTAAVTPPPPPPPNPAPQVEICMPYITI